MCINKNKRVPACDIPDSGLKAQILDFGVSTTTATNDDQDPTADLYCNEKIEIILNGEITNEEEKPGKSFRKNLLAMLRDRN